MSIDRDYIGLYRTLIEGKFMLGNGEGKLKQRDLEYLSNLIEEKSRVKLSISTLKRLWKGDLQQLPHPSTLDALVSILDFKDWQAFKKQNVALLETGVTNQNSTKNKRSIRAVPVFIVLGF
ncbi:MAG TPA: hypothetical protein VE467_09515, partial [Chryseolinea sp.]|nr:hypothetical protein [Chryseolinea sp.]